MNKFKGLTVNERLYVSGLMDKFDLATKEKDLFTVKSILIEVEMKEGNIEPMLKQPGLIENKQSI